jgi:hypothetical protein
MTDDEAISRRELFSAWARGLADGVAQWVVPYVEQRLAGQEDLMRQLRDSLDGAPPVGEEYVHPWRDLLEPRQEQP